MSRLHSHIGSAIKILDKYNGVQPFSLHLKSFFSAEKKYGSKDRKTIAALCYAYFRSGQAMRKEGKTEKILAGVFLSETASSPVLQELKPEWNDRVSRTLEEKLQLLHLSAEQIVPFQEELSGEINKTAFTLSFFRQPKLFLRSRPGREAVVEKKLAEADVPFEKAGNNCFALPNSFKAGDTVRINKEVVIQDLNSQKVLNEVLVTRFSNPDVRAWDCCAASGGKSILLYDLLHGKVRLTVSDIRENMLENLRKRLDEAGVNVYKTFAADLRLKPVNNEGKFDIILCDVPCTGSGTWSRTPENLYYFHRKKIAEYAQLQRNIITNTINSLEVGGLFFYITCSVFREENESQVTFILDNFACRLVKMEYLKGYDQQADTMFVAVFSI